MSFQLSPSQIVRQLAGRSLAAILVASSVTAGLSAHAEPVVASSIYAVAMTFEASEEKLAPRVLAKAGEQFAVASGDWRIEMTVRPGPTSADVSMSAKVLKGSRIVSTPTMIARFNEKATIKVGDSSHPFSLSMVVSPQPQT
jgi:hypothetical protein